MNTETSQYVVSTRSRLGDRINAYIASFEHPRRTPDRWQGEWLMAAISHLRAGDYASGELAVRKAETTPEDRPAQEVANMPTTYDLLTIEEHRRNFEWFKAQAPY